MNIIKKLIGLFRYRMKLYYSIFRCSLSGGSFVYAINKKVNFVCHKDDSFSKIIYISNGHEKTEMAWCECFISLSPENSLIIDCGANIGYFSSYLAQTNPSCNFIAIEGNQKTFNILTRTIEKLNLSSISARQGILGESNEYQYEILDIQGREPWQQARSVENAVVPTIALDNLIEEDKMPCLIKIDCEGFEVKILKGASTILKQAASVFLVECNDEALINAGTNRSELFDVFRKNNYHLYHLASFDTFREPGLKITEDFPSREFNFVAIPGKSNYEDLFQKSLQNFSAKTNQG